MENLDIIENNKLIALFMSATIRSNFELWLPIHGVCRFDTVDLGRGKTLHYHDSYDWLIPVVEKIGLMPDGEGYMFKRSLDGGLFIGITAIYEYVTAFIKWYNSKNS